MDKNKKKKVDISQSDVESFISVTGVSADVARTQLKATGGDLLLAINMHMDGKMADPDSEPDDDVGSSTGHKRDRWQMESGSRSANSTGNGAIDGPSCSVINDEEMRAPIAPVTARLLEPAHSVQWEEPTFRRHSAFDGLRNFAVEASHQEEMLECPTQSRKKRTLEDLFRPPIHLMYHGNFSQARDAATSTKKWLLVNIQNVREFQCQILNRDVWSDSVIESVIREQFIFWQVTSDSMEGKRYMQFYQLQSWPYVGIIDPRTGECMSEYHHVAQDSFCDVLLTFLTANPWDRLEATRHVPRLASIATGNVPCDNITANQSETATSIVDATEDQQIEMALAASLREARPASPGVASRGGASRGGPARGGASPTVASRSPASPSTPPAASTPGSGNDAPDSDDDSPSSSPFRSSTPPPIAIDESAPKLSIMLRFPDGKREEACFSCTAPIMVLQQHVASRGYPTSDFELVTHFPRRNLSDLKPSTPLERASLQARDTVFVQAKS